MPKFEQAPELNPEEIKENLLNMTTDIESLQREGVDNLAARAQFIQEELDGQGREWTEEEQEKLQEHLAAIKNYLLEHSADEEQPEQKMAA